MGGAGQNLFMHQRHGTRLVFRENHPETGEDLGVLSMEGDRSMAPLVATEFIERNAELSSDGRWIAYESNASGPFEIYVRPFPDKHHSVTDKHLVLERHTFTNKRVRRNLAATTDGCVLLDLDESANARPVTDCTAIQIDDVRMMYDDSGSQRDGWRNRHVAYAFSNTGIRPLLRQNRW